jgi:glycerol-3-phosphate O-acyltransferase
MNETPKQNFGNCMRIAIKLPVYISYKASLRYITEIGLQRREVSLKLEVARDIFSRPLLGLTGPNYQRNANICKRLNVDGT